MRTIFPSVSELKAVTKHGGGNDRELVLNCLRNGKPGLFEGVT